MKQSLNLAPAIDNYLHLCVRFKMFLNVQLERKLYLFNSNLYGHKDLFEGWLLKECSIIDLNTFLKNKEKNFNRLDYYMSVAKYNNNKDIS